MGQGSDQVADVEGVTYVVDQADDVAEQSTGSEDQGTQMESEETNVEAPKRKYVKLY